jgi:hypothetical protein
MIAAQEQSEKHEKALAKKQLEQIEARENQKIKEQLEIDEEIKQINLKLEDEATKKIEIMTKSRVAIVCLNSLSTTISNVQKSNESSHEIFVKLESRLKAEISETKNKIQQEESMLVTTKIQYEEALGILNKAEMESQKVEVELFTLQDIDQNPTKKLKISEKDREDEMNVVISLV